MYLAGHIKVHGGPYVARGPDVAQACSTLYASKIILNIYLVKKLFIQS
jgi:hypothetical protein